MVVWSSTLCVCGPMLLLLLLVVTCTSQQSPPPLPQDVVVVGGGISGLAAARQLTNRGRDRFTVRVFEARRERYGGRVWTSKLKNPKARGLEVDLGASALNVLNPFNNPLLNLTSDLGLESVTLGKPQFLVPWQNKRYSGDELTRAMVQAGGILTEAVNVTRTQKHDISMREAVDKQLKTRGVPDNDVQALLLRTLPSYVTEEYSALLYQPDSLDFGYEQVLLDGMGELLDRLASGADDEIPLKISLRTAVRQIKVDKSQNKVVLRLKDGSQVMADHVIVTVPAPVIAKGTLLFEPDLPSDYKRAVKDVGLSHGNKVIVHFSAPFWSDDHDIYIVAANSDDERGNLQTWLSLHKVLGKPVLVGLFVGDAAVRMEALSDEDLRALVLQKLSKVFGEELVSTATITNILRSAWTGDQWSGVSSTYTRVGNTPKLWDTLTEPLCPNIYFAGEHTQYRGHGSLHGAYLSGVRAAEQLLSGYCQEKAREEERRRQQKKKAKQKKEKDDAVSGEQATPDDTDREKQSDSGEAEKEEL